MIPVHLVAADYPKAFPPDLDAFPTVIDEEHYIDAWHLNSAYESLLAIEDYLIAYKANIETPLGEDVLGNDGELDVVIPAARYSGYETALAWDSNLLAENLRSGVTIFGIEGKYMGEIPILIVSNWTIRSSAADNAWLSVCRSPELGLFCAVANTGVGNRVMTSANGIDWTIRSSAADNNWYSVCWSPELGLFCAVAATGVGNRVMTSLFYKE